jgi:hypothetical protein
MSKVGQSASKPPSSEYFATVRRRKAKSIQSSIAGLVEYAERDDFAAWTFPIIQQIKQLLDFLIDAEKEGNTREIPLFSRRPFQESHELKTAFAQAPSRARASISIQGPM